MKSWLPTRERLANSPWLRWLSPWLGDPKLWHWSRRGVALGVALGVFFGLLIPLAQIPVTAAAAIVLRANLPAAAASTLVTNPVTLAPLYYSAYQFGSWLTGETSLPSDVPEQTASQDSDSSIWQRIVALGAIAGWLGSHGSACRVADLLPDRHFLALANWSQVARKAMRIFGCSSETLRFQ